MQTDKIILRPWYETDAEALYKYASDPDVGARAGWPPHKSVEESREIIRTVFNTPTTWAIVLKETNEAIGAMGYMLECELRTCLLVRVSRLWVIGWVNPIGTKASAPMPCD